MLHSTLPLCPSITGLQDYRIILVDPKVNSDAISGGFCQQHKSNYVHIPPLIAAKQFIHVAGKLLLCYIFIKKILID